MFKYQTKPFVERKKKIDLRSIETPEIHSHNFLGKKFQEACPPFFCTITNSQNFAVKVRLVFQSEITDRTLAESLKIISRLKFFQTLGQSLPRNSILKSFQTLKPK